MGENLAGVEGDGKVIRRRANPLSPDGGIVILRGTLAPGSAVIKRSAASEELLRHRGRAYVFETRADLLEHIDDDDLPGRRHHRARAQERRPQGRPRHARVGAAADSRPSCCARA